MTGMHPRIGAPRCALGVLAVVVSVAGAFAQDKKLDPAQWAPKDAIAFVGVTDIDEMMDSLKKTAGWRLMQDPAAKALAEMNIALTFIEKIKGRIASALETDASKLKNPFGGPMAIYLTATGGDKPTPEVTIVLSVKDTGTMREYYDKAVSRFKKSADSHEAVSFGSQSIDYFKTKARSDEESAAKGETDEEEPAMGLSEDEQMAAMLDQIFGELFSADALPENLSLCLTESRLFIGLTPDHVKDALRREKGGDSLRDHEDYKAIGQQFKKVGPMRLFVSLPRIFEIARAADPESAREAEVVFGAKCLRSVIGHAAYAPDGKCDSWMELQILMSGERSGLAKILSMKNRAITPPAGVSADHALFASANVNAGEVFDEVERMMRQTDPEAAEAMRAEMDVQTPDGKKLNVRKDVLEHLVGPLSMALGIKTPYGQDSVRFALRLGHNNKSAIETALAIAKESGAPLQEREMAGARVFDFMFGIVIAITNDAILVGAKDSVESGVLASADGALSADANFKRAAELVPGEAWGLMYIDSRKFFEASLDLARHRDEIEQNAFMNPLSMVALGMSQAFGANVEKDKVEELRPLAKYQTPQVVTLATTPDGLRLTLAVVAGEREK